MSADLHIRIIFDRVFNRMRINGVANSSYAAFTDTELERYLPRERRFQTKF